MGFPKSGHIFYTDITFPSQDDVTVFMEGGENPVQVCATLSPPRNISVAVLFTSTSVWRDDLHKDLFVHLSAGCMCVACCVLCTCELMYVMSCYYVLYHCTMFPSNLLECCMHVFLIFSVLFLVCLELSIKDASSSPCIRSCLVCNIFSYPSLCAYSPSNTGLVVTS